MEKRDLDIILKSATNWRMYLDAVVLVTGATGRLGRYILETLADVDIKYNLNMRIIGLARSEKKVNAVFDNLIDFPNVQFLYQDVNAPIRYNGKIDYIFHTAGPAAPKDYNAPVDTLWTHVNGTHNVMECAKNHCTKRVFYISTVEIYGEWKKNQRIKETDMGVMFHCKPRYCYPEAKRLCETMLTSYKKQYGISFCGVRLCHTLGPGIALDDGRGFAEFISNVINHKNIVLYSQGEAMRTYTYVADVVNAMFLIMDQGEDMLYNVSNPDNLISIRDLAELIATLVPDRNCKVLFAEETAKYQYLPFDLAIMDISKVRALGWNPVTDIGKTFKWTIESFM